MRTKWAVAAIAIVAVVALSSFEVYQVYFASPTCLSVQGGSVVRSQTSTTSIGPIKEYDISGRDRSSSAVTAAPDGSVWFVEQEVPGVAHLFPANGTLVEYAWKGFSKPNPKEFCGPPVLSSGIALWQGKVWASDMFGGAIVGVSPADGSMTLVNTTSAIVPYWLATGPDGNLWFTSDNQPAFLGRLFPNMTVSLIRLSGMKNQYPLQLDLVNSSLAFIAAYNETADRATGACTCNGHIYSFDPSNVSSNITPNPVGGNYRIVLPTSVSYSDGRLWVAQHGASSIAEYDFASNSWNQYPTSRLLWTNITLPYFVEANGGKTWFNEHYANKIAIIDSDAGTLTEMSASNPPASNYQGIQNDEFIAQTGGGLWFTSWSGNYVGFIDATYSPSFQINVEGANRLNVQPGGSQMVNLDVSGTRGSVLTVNVSDSESYSSIPNLIHIVPSTTSAPSGNTLYTLSVEVSVDRSIKAGNYTLAVTLTEGGVQQTAYLFLSVM